MKTINQSTSDPNYVSLLDGNFKISMAKHVLFTLYIVKVVKSLLCYTFQITELLSEVSLKSARRKQIDNFIATLTEKLKNLDSSSENFPVFIIPLFFSYIL